jgi:UDPglucose--hexose-1-phosphate uridylyltransferase
MWLRFWEGGTIPEIRKHYFLEEFCIIAAERKKRPSDFKIETNKNEDIRGCPFCPGNEYKTPAAVATYKDSEEPVLENVNSSDWKVRVFPNLFSDVVPDPKSPLIDWISLPGHGYHEVIVDSPIHWDNPADFTHGHMKLVLKVCRDRYTHYSYMNGVKYVSVFKNRGKDSGATLNHTHSQVVALPIMPPTLKQEISAMTLSSFCPYCNVVDRERISKRFVSENESWILIAPYYSIAPYETWILPKGHVSNLEDLKQQQFEDLAQILLDALKRKKALLGADLPYNLLMYQLPSAYHLNIRIQPALTRIASFEKNTRVYINPVPPEEAAEELRNVKTCSN